MGDFSSTDAHRALCSRSRESEVHIEASVLLFELSSTCKQVFQPCLRCQASGLASLARTRCTYALRALRVFVPQQLRMSLWSRMQ